MHEKTLLQNERIIIAGMNPNAYAVIMAGGVGSRLWPVSRNQYPKQFHDLLGTGRTLIQSTYDRLIDLVPIENVLIVTNSIYYALVREQLPEISEQNILLEPISRNTAPCLAYATVKIRKRNPNALIIVNPSDHLIKETERFQMNIRNALRFAEENPVFVTLGVKPNRAETGFGYIQFYKDSVKELKNGFKVKVFTEKPNLVMARQFMKSGDFVWNTGIFVASVNTLWDAFDRHLSEIHDNFDDLDPILDTAEEEEQIQRVYPNCKNVSIDYGIFEKADNVFVIRSFFNWNDLGYWTSIYNQLPKDFFKNYTSGNNVMIINSGGNYIHVPKNKLAVVKGIKNMILIDTGDILLICPRSEEQSIREIVNELKKEADKNDKYI